MHIPVGSALTQLDKSGKLFIDVYSHGSLSVEVYKPLDLDLQQPHTRDEVYIVISGTGEFFDGTETVLFEPGDFLFVPAGIEHRFLNFTDDFATWVIFYGPEGGEG